ncbi:small ribosomal subunit Rsm22 family protein [Sandaracinus amylolyticus]|uniref:small ribosomal subunit Rsm22 family protein n=1 Tax=Sandaracinus amylolyticus TaxID=927083 RepID=UPI001F32E9B1|nr:small ribosomal subunit Rsm22 family protein [Sandaracinus amylolyticus]UJR86808.1 Hypothetical protein I5071_89090 [Sandaracinus amylolyticus]
MVDSIDDPRAARALSDVWIRAIDEAAPVLLGPHDRTGAALADEVARLSELYTRDRGALRSQSAALAARLRFFLPRDLPKVEGPLAELAWAGALPAGPRWKVLDLGAGLGTTTLGIATFAKRMGIEGLDVLAIERDARSLDVMKHLAAKCGRGALADETVPVTLETRELDLEPIDVRALGRGYSMVVIGLALNELWTAHPDPLERRSTLLARASEILADDGVVIVIEPALRESSRALQQLRDRIEASPRAPYVFAPCTRSGPCPMLEGERDWCHEELPLALPDALKTIARGAGLRWEGLSYAYLTLRRTPGRVADVWRIVGGPIESKGRTEWHACGEPGLVRIARLTRNRGEGDPLEGARRGSLIAIEGETTPGETLRSDRARIDRRR